MGRTWYLFARLAIAVRSTSSFKLRRRREKVQSCCW